MADLSDVEEALARAAASALYRDDAPVTGIAARVFRGWPVTSDLEVDLRAGRACVSSFARPGTGRLETRFLPRWQDLPSPPPGITAAVAGDAATFAGTTGVPLDAGVRAGGAAYVVHLAPGSDEADAALSLAAVIPGAVADGPVLRVPGCRDLLARTATRAAAVREIRRQSQVVTLTVWAPTPAARDAVAGAIDAGLAPLGFLDLPDGSRARVQYAGSATLDEPGKAGVWRRDLSYACEYPTLERREAPRLLFTRLEVRERPAGTLRHRSTE